jgi:hypothetical protein
VASWHIDTWLVDAGANRRSKPERWCCDRGAGGTADVALARTIDAAAAAAEEEITFAESLCTQPHDTLIAVHRTFGDGAVRESFRTLRPRTGSKPARAFSFLDVDGEDETPGDQIDLIAMTGRERK